MYVVHNRSQRLLAAFFIGVVFLFIEIASAQTKIRLSSQATQADFSQFTLTRPVKLGTALPPTCLTGELFFKTDASAGSNLYLCSGSSWYVINSGTSGASSLSGLSDLQVTSSSAVVSIAAGRFQALDTTGRYTVTEFSAATVTRVGGTDGGILRLEMDDNAGSPILRCLYGTGLSPANYSASGCVTASQNNFTVGAQPLASVAIVSGVWATPQDLRAVGGTANYSAGSGLNKAGNMFSVNPAVVAFLGSANAWTARQTFGPTPTTSGLNVGALAGNPSAPLNGDLWYDSAAQKLTARIDGANVALGKLAPFFTSMDFGVCDSGGANFFNGHFYTNASDTPAQVRACNAVSGQAYGVWADGAVSRHMGRWHIPAGAGTALTATIVWAGNAASSTGNVELAFNWACRAEGETFSTLPTYASDTTAAANEGSVVTGIKYTNLSVTLSGCAGKELWLKFGRNGAAPADTSTTDTYVLGLKLKVE